MARARFAPSEFENIFYSVLSTTTPEHFHYRCDFSQIFNDGDALITALEVECPQRTAALVQLAREFGEQICEASSAQRVIRYHQSLYGSPPVPTLETITNNGLVCVLKRVDSVFDFVTAYFTHRAPMATNRKRFEQSIIRRCQLYCTPRVVPGVPMQWELPGPAHVVRGVGSGGVPWTRSNIEFIVPESFGFDDGLFDRNAIP